MGKVKRAARKHSNHHDAPKPNTKTKVIRRQHSLQKPHGAKHIHRQGASHGQSEVRLKVPFTKHDSVLLVGEGDFSFALALKEHHKTGHLLATSFDSKNALENKYPDTQKTLSKLDPSLADKADGNDDDASWEGLSPSPPDSPVDTDDLDQARAPAVRVIHGVDATKLSSTHKKALKPHSPFTKIVFNFPHVGGLSTDVNRQVRYNQELLVGFFKSAKPLLSSPSRPAKVRQATEYDAGESNDLVGDGDDRSSGGNSGQILVTLFEGEPYTLWNIRDLARHCGLKVVKSFKFPWSAYPGYRHARTIGDITSGKDRTDEGKRKGAWRGEERDARCYVLEDKDAPSAPSRKQKRKRGEEGDTSD